MKRKLLSNEQTLIVDAYPWKIGKENILKQDTIEHHVRANEEVLEAREVMRRSLDRAYSPTKMVGWSTKDNVNAITFTEILVDVLSWTLGNDDTEFGKRLRYYKEHGI